MASRKDALITGIPYDNLPASEHAVYICGWQDITETRDLIHALEVERNKAINATVAKASFWQQ